MGHHESELEVFAVGYAKSFEVFDRNESNGLAPSHKWRDTRRSVGPLQCGGGYSEIKFFDFHRGWQKQTLSDFAIGTAAEAATAAVTVLRGLKVRERVSALRPVK